jgi:hypothetical protein
LPKLEPANAIGSALGSLAVSTKFSFTLVRPGGWCFSRAGHEEQGNEERALF